MITDRGRRVKAAYFTLEGLSSFAMSLYSYYIYFFMRDQFGFGNKDNLAFAAVNGLIYHLRLAGRTICAAPRLFHRAQDRFQS